MPKSLEDDAIDCRTLKPGARHRRAYVGPPAQYDFMGATQLMLAVSLGLREEHTVLDIGCGSLRAGRLLIQYLLPNRYFGIEPNEWLWKEAVDVEIGRDMIFIKKPVFSGNDKFDFELFGKKFDFIVAQSIFSHTGKSLFEEVIYKSEKVLKETGQFVFTVLNEVTPGYRKISDGNSVFRLDLPGMLYISVERCNRCM